MKGVEEHIHVTQSNTNLRNAVEKETLPHTTTDQRKENTLWSVVVATSTKDLSPEEYQMFTGVFGKQILTSFDYNKKDQTRDARTCCAYFWCVFIKFVGCLTNGTRPCGAFRQVLKH